jgi:hypothetical protein
MKLERHDPITAVGTIKAGAGDIVGQLASLGALAGKAGELLGFALA